MTATTVRYRSVDDKSFAAAGLVRREGAARQKAATLIAAHARAQREAAGVAQFELTSLALQHLNQWRGRTVIGEIAGVYSTIRRAHREVQRASDACPFRRGDGERNPAQSVTLKGRSNIIF